MICALTFLPYALSDHVVPEAKVVYTTKTGQSLQGRV